MIPGKRPIHARRSSRAGQCGDNGTRPIVAVARLAAIKAKCRIMAKDWTSKELQARQALRGGAVLLDDQAQASVLSCDFDSCPMPTIQPDFLSTVPPVLTLALVQLAPFVAAVRKFLQLSSWSTGNWYHSWLVLAAWWAICVLLKQVSCLYVSQY